MQQENEMLSGKTAVVTGASRGIGRAIAEKLAAEGAFVVINYNGSKEAAETVLAGIRAAGGDGCVMQCNVSDFAACEVWMKEILALYGKIDILVNNAGVTRDNLILRLSEEDFDTVLNANLKGAFLCCKEAARRMVRQRYGRIVNLRSVVGLRGNAGQTNYSASKAGLIGLTKALAKEEGPSGITVNCVAPGVIDTDMMASFTAEDKAALAEETPVGRLGTAEEVAKLLLYLAGEDAGYITGQVFGVNGGLVI